MINYKNVIKVIASIVAVIYAYKCANGGRDFEVFVYAGHKIINGLNIYKPPFIQNLTYYYSPLFALLLAPVSSLPIIVPQLAWIICSYFFLYRIWILCTAYFDLSQLSTKQKQLWLGLSFFLALRFILFDLLCVQMTIFMLWATLQSLQWFKEDRDVSGAALLAFAINIKLLPLPFIFYLFYRKKIKAGLLVALFYTVYLYLPAIYLGWDKNAVLLHDWFSLINPTNKEWSIEAEDGPSSLVALIPVYLTDTVGVLNIKRNFVNLPLEQVITILNAVRLAFVALTMLFLRSLPFRSMNNQIRKFWEMGYLFIVIPLIFPHQQLYAFMYITPAFIYLTWYFITSWETLKPQMNFFKWIPLALIAFICSPLIGRDIISSYFYELLLYFRILPMIAMLLMVMLWVYRPKAQLNTPA